MVGGANKTVGGANKTEAFLMPNPIASWTVFTRNESLESNLVSSFITFQVGVLSKC